jgi:hypothetical protein
MEGKQESGKTAELFSIQLQLTLGSTRNFPFLLLYSSIVSLYVSFEETSLSSLNPYFSNDFGEV